MCARVGGCAATSGLWRGLGCGLLGAVVLLQEVPVQAFERAEGGGIPGGGVLDFVAWQSDLLSRACKGAQEGNKDDDIFYLFLQKQKIGAKLHIYL